MDCAGGHSWCRAACDRAGVHSFSRGQPYRAGYVDVEWAVCGGGQRRGRWQLYGGRYGGRRHRGGTWGIRTGGFSGKGLFCHTGWHLCGRSAFLYGYRTAYRGPESAERRIWGVRCFVSGYYLCGWKRCDRSKWDSAECRLCAVWYHVSGAAGRIFVSGWRLPVSGMLCGLWDHVYERWDSVRGISGSLF